MQSDLNVSAYVQTPFIDADRNATSEIEASLMAWDLYAYIKELENALKACKEMK